jgi:hypothetical protein
MAISLIEPFRRAHHFAGRILLISALGLGFSACGPTSTFNREAGSVIDNGSFGNATMHNHLVQTGQIRVHNAHRPHPRRQRVAGKYTH